MVYYDPQKPLPSLKISSKMALCRVIPRWIIEILDHLKTQEMCIEAVRIEPVSMVCVSGRFKAQEMCDKAVRTEPLLLECVPDCFKTQQICDEAVRKCPLTLMHAPHWLVREQHIGPWDDNDFLRWHKDKWHDDYQRRKAQKAKIKEGLLPIA